jgi:cell division protein FtsA
MSRRNRDESNLITVLDAGSHKVCVIVAEVHDGVLRYRGHGIQAAAGTRRGAITDLKSATDAINHAALAAERIAQIDIESCVIGVGGLQIRGINCRGGIRLGSRMREITREELRSVTDSARTVQIPQDREVLHQLTQEFSLDGQTGIYDPLGMVGSVLEVSLHLNTCSAASMQSIITCANKAGLEVEDTVYEGIASAEAVLSADERELGICIVDIGAGTTEIAVYFEGAVQHTGVLPIGGDYFTNDLAVGLRLPVEEAEEVKCRYGNAVVTSVPQQSEIETGGNLALGAGQPVRRIRQRQLAEILEPRAREFFEMLRDNLRHAGVLEALGAGCVLTGGGAMLPGMLDVAESMLRVPARVGWPVQLSRMPRELARPEFSSAIGMLLYTHRSQISTAAESSSGLRSKLRAIFAGSF